MTQHVTFFQTAYYQQAQLVKSPANFPVPVVNGAPVAPVLNTTPQQVQDPLC